MTAVDYLITWMTHNQYFIGNDLLNAFEQAKEMEKQQIIDAYANAVMKENDSDYVGMHEQSSGEIYFAETYGSKGSDDIKGIGSKDINGNEMIFDQQLFNYFSQEFNINLLGTEIQDIIDIVKKYTTSSQTEISDEEIEKAIDELNTDGQSISWEYGFREGSKWYREQLKKKQ